MRRLTRCRSARPAHAAAPRVPARSARRAAASRLRGPLPRRRRPTPAAGPAQTLGTSRRLLHDAQLDQPLHRAARTRRRRQRRMAATWARWPRHRAQDRRPREAADRHDDHRARPERGHADSFRAWAWAHPGDRARLLPDGGAVPVLARSAHHHGRRAGRAGRHPVDAGAHRHDAQRRVADGRDHGGGHRGVELDPARELRERGARRARAGRAGGGAARPGGRGCGRC